MALSRSLGKVHTETLRERGPREEPVLAPTTMMGCETGQEGSGFWVDTDSVIIFLSQRMVDDLEERLRAWPPWRKTETVKKGLVEAGKLHHAIYVVTPPP